MPKSENMKRLEHVLVEHELMEPTGKVDYKKIKKGTGIPDRTLRSWFSGDRDPAPWVIDLLVFYFNRGGFR